jgi:hypothetical protein
MKLNISYPANGSQKIIEIDDERKLRPFMEKRMGTEVSIPDPKNTHTHHPDELLHTYTHTQQRGRREQLADWNFTIRFPVNPSATSSRATSSRLPVVTTSKVRRFRPSGMLWAWRTEMEHAMQ